MPNWWSHFAKCFLTLPVFGKWFSRIEISSFLQLPILPFVWSLQIVVCKSSDTNYYFKGLGLRVSGISFGQRTKYYSTLCKETEISIDGLVKVQYLHRFCCWNFWRKKPMTHWVQKKLKQKKMTKWTFRFVCLLPIWYMFFLGLKQSDRKLKVYWLQTIATVNRQYESSVDDEC